MRAVEAALQIQRDLAGGEVRVRIGLNAGEPIAEDDDFFGTAVQLAARICDRAEPGQILVSRVVADLCAGKRLSFQSAGEAHMKGLRRVGHVVRGGAVSEYRVIHFRSIDGSTIAAAHSGSGFPVLFVPAVMSELQRFRWGSSPAGFKVITYDRRGTGMSDAQAPNSPPEAYVDDIQAVIEGLALDEFALVGDMFGAPEAMAVAARNPEACSHLVLRTPILSVEDWASIPRIRALLSVMEEDWAFFVNAWFRSLDWENPGIGAFVRSILERWTPDRLRGLVDGLLPLDVSEALPKIGAETLLIHDPAMWYPEDYSRAIAGAIPTCSMMVLPTPVGFSRWALQDEATWTHLSGLAKLPSETDSDATSFQTIMFTDLESSTALTQRLGDAGAQEVLHGHNDAVRKSLEAHGGREVKHTGDGIMAAFPSAVRAVEAALQIQRDLAGAEVRVRIGLNAGEPIAEDDDFFGTAVQLAARICDRAEPGQILVSRVVADLCAGKQLSFQSAGEAHMKGFDKPVALFEAGA